MDYKKLYAEKLVSAEKLLPSLNLATGLTMAGIPALR